MSRPARALAVALSLWASAAHSAQPPQLDEVALPRFRVWFTPRAATAEPLLARSLEGARDELARRLGHDWEGVTSVYVADGPEEALAIAPPNLIPPRWAAGVALPPANTLLFDARVLRGPEGRQVLLHELAHLALGRTGHAPWPRWFQEGFAMLVAGEWSVSRYTAMYRVTVRDGAIPLAELTDRWPDRLSEVEVAYAESFSFVSHVYEGGGEQRFRDLIAAVAGGRAFADGFREVYGTSLDDQEAAWRRTLSSRYSWVPVLFGQGPLWTLITLLFLWAYWRVRRRTRERMAAMELDEKAVEAALRIAQAEALRAERPEPAPPKDLLN